MKLQHGRVTIALHALAERPGLPLLLLHQLGGSAEEWAPAWLEWPGAVFALDFAGHGDSDRVRGGGYYPEYLLADADLALDQIGGRAALAGRGVGAYVALLLAGARPQAVPASLLLPGRGLAGGGSQPDFDAPAESVETWMARIDADAKRYREGSDPMLSSCEHDLRPSDYAADFAAAATWLLFSDEIGSADAAPEWWQVARSRASGAAAPADPAAALALLHARSSAGS